MKLNPSKNSHPDKTVINTSYLILKKISKTRTEKYEDLRTHIKQKVIGGDFLFIPALNLLYILGIIKYYPKNDIIEYVVNHEAI
ncbi:ABC-three component system middle component 8 [Maridesulfovibrio ferrireducens]|uniref:ABC-three component system middle component 8 n=1 Tax=Maridesulfovibrio ferrireducens TaxID=246191 RepID=UPI001A323831|nr:ABC-three component system middle component 8 [Maridesulfovibrio ferrireducens]MBI9112751.1 hypothetical protein [Maridesulfovibrio ferrireducens]